MNMQDNELLNRQELKPMGRPENIKGNITRKVMIQREYFKRLIYLLLLLQVDFWNQWLQPAIISLL